MVPFSRTEESPLNTLVRFGQPFCSERGVVADCAISHEGFATRKCSIFGYFQISLPCGSG